MKTTDMRDILKNWEIILREERPELDIAGSPDRTEFRTCIEDSDDNLYIFEELKRGTMPRKKEIINILNRLKKNEMSKIVPYIPASDGKYIVYHKDNYYQLSSYIEGKKLQRPEYVTDSWRGEVMAKFLIELSKKSKDISGDKFNLPDYISELLRTINEHNPKIHEQAKMYASSLVNLFNDYDNLTFTFCHGDFHPLNMIWAETEINAVIDWEFCGIKPELYDIALLIGCIGMEDPKALTGTLISKFLKTVKKSGMIKEWGYLHEMILAIRFAWLSEWLRFEEMDFVNLELDYMQILLEKKEELRSFWQNI